MDTQQFLTMLFGGKPDYLYILTWQLKNKRSAWFTSIDEAVQHVQNKEDVYVGASLSDKDRGAFQRYEAKETAGIVGLWLDIDIFDPISHKKGNLPKSYNEALHFLKNTTPEPYNILVDSGHGLQAWWIFETPWVYQNEEERELAAVLEQKWNIYFQNEAKVNGWSIDSVHDLSRVFRIPGTINAKNPQHKKEVTVIEANKSKKPLEHYLNIANKFNINIEKPFQTTIKNEALVLNPNAEPPASKLIELLKNQKFKATLEHKRRDFIDQSASSYDLSLADFAVKAQWEDQEIVNLLIYHRRINNADLKLREDYYQRTLEKAKSSNQFEIMQSEIENLDKENENEDIKKAKGLEIISGVIGVQVLKVIRYATEPPSYRLETNKGSVMVPRIDDLIQQSKFRSLIASTCKVYIPKMKSTDWDVVATQLVQAQEDVDFGKEVKEAGIVENWLLAYFDFKPPVEQPDDTTYQQRIPFIKEDECYLFLDNFIKFVRINAGENITPQKLSPILGLCGCEPETLNLEIRKKRTTRRVWKIPKIYWES